MSTSYPVPLALVWDSGTALLYKILIVRHDSWLMTPWGLANYSEGVTEISRIVYSFTVPNHSFNITLRMLQPSWI
jgi:hypothetical protein